MRMLMMRMDMCMYKCICICVYIYIHTCKYGCVYRYICKHLCVMKKNIYVRPHVYTPVPSSGIPTQNKTSQIKHCKENMLFTHKTLCAYKNFEPKNGAPSMDIPSSSLSTIMLFANGGAASNPARSF